MHNPAALLENETDKLQWHVKIQTDYLILARQPDLITMNNKKKKKELTKFWTLQSQLITENN